MVNVFSFCIYGPYNPKYYIGLKENIKIIFDKFPGFHIHIWIGNDADIPKINELLFDFFKSKIKLLHITDKTGPILMLYRYLSIDFENVDCIFSRDADSRIGTRDIWCINKFLESSFILHTIRDHKGHFMKMMGGLSGMKKEILVHILSFNNVIVHTQKIIANNEYNVDQTILQLFIYNNFKNLLLVHSTKNIFNDENFEYIPLEVNKENFCGQVIDYDENMNKIYVHDYKDYD
jgi:hypothetical protein